MFTKHIPLNNKQEILFKKDLLQMFREKIDKKHKFESKKFKILKRIGEGYEVKNIESKVLPLLSDENRKISRINYSEFVREILRTADKYRLVGEDVYQISEESYINDAIKDEGEYIYSIDGNPEFKIYNSKGDKGYIWDKMKIESFDEKEFVNYMPERSNDQISSINHAKIEAQIKKGSILYEFYLEILEKHKTR